MKLRFITLALLALAIFSVAGIVYMMNAGKNVGYTHIQEARR